MVGRHFVRVSFIVFEEETYFVFPVTRVPTSQSPIVIEKLTRPFRLTAFHPSHTSLVPRANNVSVRISFKYREHISEHLEAGHVLLFAMNCIPPGSYRVSVGRASPPPRYCLNQFAAFDAFVQMIKILPKTHHEQR